jgi:hypothetical protein
MIFLLVGVALLILVLRDVFQSVVVPRGKVTAFRIAPFLVRNILWPPFRFAASKIASPVWRAEILGLFGPIVLIKLLTVWISLLICAYGLVTFALAREYSPPLESFFAALYVAGSSVLTLGAGEYVAKTNSVRFLMLAAAFCGMIVTALVVSLLFTLIGSIQRREVLVSVTSNISGSPPCGISILETHATLKGRQHLAAFYDGWHLWCADVLETHRAYPILPYFRSTDAFTSWLTALGAVLDSAALVLSTDLDGSGDLFSANVVYRSGTTLIKELAAGWRLDPSATTEINDEEFHEVYLRLQQCGYCSSTEDQFKANFQQLRNEYIVAHRALCDYVSVPQTPLSTDYRFPATLPNLGDSVSSAR